MTVCYKLCLSLACNLEPQLLVSKRLWVLNAVISADPKNLKSGLRIPSFTHHTWVRQTSPVKDFLVSGHSDSKVLPPSSSRPVKGKNQTHPSLWLNDKDEQACKQWHNFPIVRSGFLILKCQLFFFFLNVTNLLISLSVHLESGMINDKEVFMSGLRNICQKTQNRTRHSRYSSH